MFCLWCDQHFHESVSWRGLFGIKEQEMLCEKCRQSLTIISGEICRLCGRMIELTLSEYIDGDVCVDCVRWEEDANWGNHQFKNRSLYIYDEPMKEFIARFKFRGDALLIEAIKVGWKLLWKELYTEELIVPIPLSKERSYERGFNQSLLLAQLLTSEVHDVLTRPYHLEKQSKKTRSERVHSMSNIFQLKEGHDVIGKKIVLIDDIYTTGTTVRNAAKTLYEQGAARVTSLTLARGI